MGASMIGQKVRYRVSRALARVLPASFTYADELSTTGRSVVKRVVLGAVGITIGVAGLALATDGLWRDIVGGAAVAWGASLITWTVVSHQQSTAERRTELRRAAETDLILARLNQLGAAIGVPTLDLDMEFEPAVLARLERLAHYSGLDELRPVDAPLDYSFWTPEAMGRRP